MELYPDISSMTPWNHFGRKNIGYLYAIHAGAQQIWDFDDDNTGIADIDEIIGEDARIVCSNSSIINPYMYFGVNETISWPRGLPLDHVRDVSTFNFPLCNHTIDPSNLAVVQSLADIEPDVDGIYRLTRTTPFNFTGQPGPLVIPHGSFAPFNAQATMWFKKAFVFMFLPTTVHGRVSDIWRSYIAEYFMPLLNANVVFTRPYVYQQRNAHNFLGDFQSESDLYLKAPGLLSYLHSRPISDSRYPIHEALHLYVDLYEHDIVEENDIILFTLWLKYLGLSPAQSHLDVVTGLNQ